MKLVNEWYDDNYYRYTWDLTNLCNRWSSIYFGQWFHFSWIVESWVSEEVISNFRSNSRFPFVGNNESSKRITHDGDLFKPCASLIWNEISIGDTLKVRVSHRYILNFNRNVRKRKMNCYGSSCDGLDIPNTSVPKTPESWCGEILGRTEGEVQQRWKAKQNLFHRGSHCWQLRGPKHTRDANCANFRTLRQRWKT